MNLSLKVWMRACPWHQLPIQQSQIKVAPESGVRNSTMSAREFKYLEKRERGLGVIPKEDERIGPLGWPTLNVRMAKADIKVR